MMMVMMIVMMTMMYYMLDEYMNKRINKAELRFCINPQLIGSPSTLLCISDRDLVLIQIKICR